MDVTPELCGGNPAHACYWNGLRWVRVWQLDGSVCGRPLSRRAPFGTGSSDGCRLLTDPPQLYLKGKAGLVIRIRFLWLAATPHTLRESNRGWLVKDLGRASCDVIRAGSLWGARRSTQPSNFGPNQLMNLQPGEGGVRAWTGHVASMEWRSSSLVLGGTI